MKNMIKFLISGLLLMAFAGCKEDKLTVFEGNDNIYFQSTKWPSNTQQGYTASLNYNDRHLSVTVGSGHLYQVVDSMTVALNFLNPELPSDITFLPVSLLGKPQPFERKIGWVVADAGKAVEGVDFKVLDAFIPANATKGGIVVELFRKNAGQGTYLKVAFRLTENENFKVDYPTIPFSRTDPKLMSTLEMKIRWTDGLEPPTPYWKYDGVEGWENTLCYPALGSYSVRKMFVIHDHLGVPWATIYHADGSANTAFVNLASVYGTLLYKWLMRYEELNGVPYKEEDGTPMKSGAQFYL